MAVRKTGVRKTGIPVSLTLSPLVPHMANLPKTPLTSLLTALKAEEAIRGARAAIRTLDGATTTRIMMVGIKAITKAAAPGAKVMMEADGVLRQPMVSRANPPTHLIILRAPSPLPMLVLAHKLTLVQMMEEMVGAKTTTVGELQQEVRMVAQRATRPQSSNSKIGAHRSTNNRMRGQTQDPNRGEAHRAQSLLPSSTHHLVTT